MFSLRPDHPGEVRTLWAVTWALCCRRPCREIAEYGARLLEAKVNQDKCIIPIRALGHWHEGFRPSPRLCRFWRRKSEVPVGEHVTTAKARLFSRHSRLKGTN